MFLLVLDNRLYVCVSMHVVLHRKSRYARLLHIHFAEFLTNKSNFSYDNRSSREMAGRIGDVMLPAIIMGGNYGC